MWPCINQRWSDSGALFLGVVGPVTLPRSPGIREGRESQPCLGNKLSHPEATRAVQSIICLNRIEPFTCQSVSNDFFHPSPSHTQCQGSQRRIYLRFQIIVLIAPARRRGNMLSNIANTCWDMLGLVTVTEKMAILESTGITRWRRLWRPTKLAQILGINSAILFTLPARASAHQSRVYIEWERFYICTQLNGCLLSNKA